MNQRRTLPARVRRIPRDGLPSTFLALGARALVVTPAIIGWRAIRHLASLGTAALPALAIGAALWLASDPQTVPRSAEAAGPSGAAVALTAVVASLALALRAAATALEFAAARATLSAKPVSARAVLRDTWAGYAALALLNAALGFGIAAVALPVVGAAVGAVADSPGSWLGAVALAASLFVALGAILTARYATMLFEAHLAWEPGFVARAVAGALGGPVLRSPLHARLLALWAFGAGLVALVGATFGTIAIACWFDRIPVPPAAVGGVVVTAAVGAVVGAWFDAALVALVGHGRGHALVVRVPGTDSRWRPTAQHTGGLVAGVWSRTPDSAMAFPPDESAVDRPLEDPA